MRVSSDMTPHGQQPPEHHIHPGVSGVSRCCHLSVVVCCFCVACACSWSCSCLVCGGCCRCFPLGPRCSGSEEVGRGVNCWRRPGWWWWCFLPGPRWLLKWSVAKKYRWLGVYGNRRPQVTCTSLLDVQDRLSSDSLDCLSYGLGRPAWAHCPTGCWCLSSGSCCISCCLTFDGVNLLLVVGYHAQTSLFSYSFWAA